MGHKEDLNVNDDDKHLESAIKPSPEAASLSSTLPLPSVSAASSIFTPIRLLAIFCVINLLNYVDRGVIASNGVNGTQKICNENGACTAGSGIQGDFTLNNFQDGVLSSAFMVGLLVASPIFASLAERYGSNSFIQTAQTAPPNRFWVLIIFGLGRI